MMPIKNALIVVKEELILNKSKLIPQSPFKKGKKTSIHDQTLQEVQLSLVALGIQSKSILRSEVQHENIKNYDLIVTVGGDGTFLETSHFVFDLIPMIAVNSNPDRSHGAYCSATLESFYPTLLNLMKQKAPLFRLHRLQLSIRHKKIRVLALNDILFANACPAGTSRYEIQIGKKKEEQKS
ncbi:MAG: NAD(+)/NADH kinase, partial [Deltaproteobacteria bacterium]|nr:NAD(+)/NADH kinase [Deltaproteobacteria bacterium]